MGKILCQFDVEHGRCRCRSQHVKRVECDKPDEHGPRSLVTNPEDPAIKALMDNGFVVCGRTCYMGYVQEYTLFNREGVRVDINYRNVPDSLKPPTRAVEDED